MASRPSAEPRARLARRLMQRGWLRHHRLRIPEEDVPAMRVLWAILDDRSRHAVACRWAEQALLVDHMLATTPD